MSDKELRELDCYIAENVMGWSNAEQDPNFKQDEPHYTTDPDAAMQVLEKCLEREGIMPQITTAGKRFVWANPKVHEPYHDAETFPVAICEYAKHLFSK